MHREEGCFRLAVVENSPNSTAAWNHFANRSSAVEFGEFSPANLRAFHARGREVERFLSLCRSQFSDSVAEMGLASVSCTRAVLRRPSASIVMLREEGCFCPAIARRRSASRAGWNDLVDRVPARDADRRRAAGLRAFHATGRGVDPLDGKIECIGGCWRAGRVNAQFAKPIPNSANTPCPIPMACMLEMGVVHLLSTNRRRRLPRE
jgi:hypothetical protein